MTAESTIDFLLQEHNLSNNELTLDSLLRSCTSVQQYLQVQFLFLLQTQKYLCDHDLFNSNNWQMS